ncbi:unnamed protein product [Lactuca virosa]|uniref:Uncharacterized protein n=1 Tax=Lactuca virosa TaxID=75947 RepID=A0AAU9M356_9ASTR|nr:unnamed protein product [Lactuca virosa]
MEQFFTAIDHWSVAGTCDVPIYERFLFFHVSFTVHLLTASHSQSHTVAFTAFNFFLGYMVNGIGFYLLQSLNHRLTALQTTISTLLIYPIQVTAFFHFCRITQWIVRIQDRSQPSLTSIPNRRTQSGHEDDVGVLSQSTIASSYMKCGSCTLLSRTVVVAAMADHRTQLSSVLNTNCLRKLLNEKSGQHCDALATAKKLTSNRKDQLIKLHKYFLNMREYSDKLKRCEDQL